MNVFTAKSVAAMVNAGQVNPNYDPAYTITHQQINTEQPTPLRDFFVFTDRSSARSHIHIHRFEGMALNISKGGGKIGFLSPVTALLTAEDSFGERFETSIPIPPSMVLRVADHAREIINSPVTTMADMIEWERESLVDLGIDDLYPHRLESKHAEPFHLPIRLAAMVYGKLTKFFPERYTTEIDITKRALIRNYGWVASDEVVSDAPPSRDAFEDPVWIKPKPTVTGSGAFLIRNPNDAWTMARCLAYTRTIASKLEQVRIMTNIGDTRTGTTTINIDHSLLIPQLVAK